MLWYVNMFNLKILLFKKDSCMILADNIVTSEYETENLQTLIRNWINSLLDSDGVIVRNLIQRMMHICETCEEPDIDMTLLISLLRLSVIFASILQSKPVDMMIASRNQFNEKSEMIRNAINRCMNLSDKLGDEITQIKSLAHKLNQCFLKKEIKQNEEESKSNKLK